MIILSETLKSKPFLLDFISSGLDWNFDRLDLSQINCKKDFIEQYIKISASPLKLTKRVLKYPLKVVYSLVGIYDAYCSERLLIFLSHETSLLEGSFNPHLINKGVDEILIYLFTCFFERQLGTKTGDSRLLRDYLSMSLDHGLAPNVKIKSFKRLVIEHDRLVNEVSLKNVPDFEIKDPSLLPHEMDGYVFDCICNREQLLNEAREMKHCVASYAEEIKSGDSIIYSISGKERATAEFMDSGRVYRLAQVKSFCNKDVSDTLWSLLKKLTTKEEEKGIEEIYFSNIDQLEIPF